MDNNRLCENIYYIGVDDKDIDLFEGQYIVPNGLSYNSYVIMDDKSLLWILLICENVMNGNRT